MAEPGVLADFGLHRLDATLDAIRPDQREIHGLRAGSNAARSGAPVVWPQRRVGVLSRSMAFRRICGIRRGPVLTARSRAQMAKGLHRILAATAHPHSRKERFWNCSK